MAAGDEREPVRGAVGELVEAGTFEYESVTGEDSDSWRLGVDIHTDSARSLAGMCSLLGGRRC